MARRIKAKNKKKKEIVSNDAKTVGKVKRPEHKWFGLFLVVLIAILAISTLLLTFSLSASLDWSYDSAVYPAVNTSSKSRSLKAVGIAINDPALGFELTVPANFGEWVYKTGFVKSLVDDSVSDQYLQIFSVLSKKGNNFDDKNKNVLTVMKYTEDEWDALEKGCDKGNANYCNLAGKELGRKDDLVYAYIRPENCSKEIEAQCRLTDKILESFSLK